MAIFTPHPTVVPGDTWTAANQVTYIKNNFDAIFVGQARGDMDFYSAANAKSRLALSPGGLLYSGALDPAWLAKPAALSLLQHDGTNPSYLAKGAAWQYLRMNDAGNAFEFAASPVTRLTGSGNQAVSAGNPVNWATEVYDDGGWHDGGSPSRVTVPAGRYRISGLLGFWTPTGGATGIYVASLRINGNPVYQNRKPFYHDGTMQSMGFPSLVASVGAGAYFELVVDGGGTLNMDHSWFVVELAP